MSNSDRARLGRNLKTAREAACVTQTQAAAAVQRTRQTIVNWENEEHSAEPSTPQLAVLGELYGVTPKDLRFAEIERQPARAKEMPTESFEPVSSKDAAKKRGRSA